MAGNAKTNGNVLFAVLLAIAGSLTIGGTRIVPFQATAVPKEVADRVDKSVNPVQFFESEDEAKAEAAKWRAKAEEKKKAQK
jgi:hypothetical protein